MTTWRSLARCRHRDGARLGRARISVVVAGGEQAPRHWFCAGAFPGSFFPSSRLSFQEPSHDLFAWSGRRIGALDMLEALALAPLPFVLRHVSGDWGELCDEDKASNAAALTHGSRVLSAYDIAPNHRLWIITEADRRSTTLLLPEEY